MRESSEAVQVPHPQADEIRDGVQDEVPHDRHQGIDQTTHQVIRLDTVNCKWKKKTGAAVLAWVKRTDEELRQFQAEQKRRHLSLVHSCSEGDLQPDRIG